MSIVLVVGAPSGAGKTTLLHLLMERQTALRFSVSHTTRARREGETDGVDYHFVTPAAFEHELAGGGFLEWAEVYGNRYGTHRLEVARALALEPQVLLLDEPLAGLNSIEAARLADTVADINRQGLTVVMIEHNLGEVLRISQRLVVLDNGRKIADGKPLEVMHNPTVRAAYVGKERQNAAA